MGFQKEQCKSNYLYSKQLVEGHFGFKLEPLAREPSLVSYSISNQNHIPEHNFHIGLPCWLVLIVLSYIYMVMYCV